MSLSKYPKRLDLFQTKKNAQFSGDPNGDFVMAEDVNQLQDAISAIEKALGVEPQGNKTSVGERISLLEGSSSLRVPSFLIYLGKPALINGSETLLEAAGHFAKYDHVVIGEMAQDPSDPDYQGTLEIIETVRASKDVKFYGYIDCGVNTVNLSVPEIQMAIQQWKDIDASGVYCANFGFESRVDRDRQNLILDSIHQHEMVAILNGAEPKELFSDLFHETMNPNWLAPHTQEGDVYHYNSYCLDTSRTAVYEPNVMGEIMKLIALYEYRVENGIRIFATPVIQSTVPQAQAQAYYDYAHVSALVTSMDAFHPVTEGYGAATNFAPTYDWVPIAGSWYMASPRIEYDEQGILCTRETPFGRIILNTQEHTYKYEGIYIPYSLLQIAANTIEGNLIKDNTIDDIKMKSYKGGRLIDSINAETDATKRIDIGKIMELSYDNLDGTIPTDVLRANVIEAINANIGYATIGAAKIGDLTAGHIKSGTIDAGHIKGSVIEAINLYAETIEAGSAVIGEAVIGDLKAEKITSGHIKTEVLEANVVNAINLKAQGANIENLHAKNITAGNIKAERIQAEVVNALNLYSESAVINKAVINSAIVGDLTAGHMRGSVIEAINASVENLKVNNAKIGQLSADHIKGSVIEAINASIETAVIDEAQIGNLSASKITAGTVDADHLKGSVLTAINASVENLKVDHAKIGDLTAEHIQTGTLKAEVMQGNIVNAVELYAQKMTAESATINTAVIGALDAKHIQGAVVDAINLSAETAIIDNAKIGELGVDNLKAAVIQAVNASIENVVIDEGSIGTLNARKITSGELKTEVIQANVLKAINASVETATIDSAKIGVLEADKMKAAVIEAINASIETATIDAAQIGELKAENIQTEVIKAINASIETAVIDSAQVGTMSADHIKAVVLEALNAKMTTATIDNAVIGALSVDNMKGTVVEAVNSYTGLAVIGEAKIGNLSAAKITSGDIATKHLQANTVAAINASIDNVNATHARIESAAIGSLKSENIEAEVIKAINASIETAVIEAANIGELTAGHIKASVFEAINGRIGTAVIDSAKIGELTADKISGAVIEALEANIDVATINEALISTLNAGKIKGGQIEADVLTANIVSAINSEFQTATINAAKVGTLSADHIKTAVIEAINANIDVATINKAMIPQLDSDHIRANVISAINANITGTALINSAVIDSISSKHIEASVISAINANINKAYIDKAIIPSLDATHIQANVIDAINTTITGRAVIHQAQIGELSAKKITSDDIAADRIRANVVSAINSEFQTAKINAAKIGTLTAGHIQATVIEAINGHIHSATIDAAKIGTLTAGHIQASVIEAINGHINSATIDSAKIGELAADRMSANVIAALEANVNTAHINEALIQTLNASKIKGGEIDAVVMTANVIKAINADLTTAAIDAAQIGELKAENIQTEVIKAINASIETAVIDSANIGTLTADHMKVRVLDAINASVETIKIKEGQIQDLTAGKITSGQIKAEVLTTNVVHAINATAQTAQINQAKIGELSAKKITADDIDTLRIKANAINAINAYISDTLITNKAVIDSAAVGTLSADHMQAKVLSAINASIETIDAKQVTINKAKIGQLDANNIEADAIQTKHILAGAVTAGEIAADAVQAGHIAADAVTASEIAAGAVTTAKLDAGAVTADKIAALAISAGHIAAGTITATQIATDTITAGNIAAGAITASEIAVDAVTTDKILAGAITTDEIAAGAVTAAKIFAGSIETGHIAAGAITTATLAADAVTAINIAADAVTATKIKAGEVKAGHIAAGSIEANHIKAATITSAHIATIGLSAKDIKSDFLSADRIAAGTITGEKLVAGSIETKHLKAGQIDGSVIKGDTIHGSKIIAGTLSASNLTAGSITSVEIAAKTIQTRNLAVGSVDAQVIRAGTITAEHISTVGLDANQIEVFGNDGQVLIGDGYLRVDGLDVGVVQSDNLIGNGLFLTAASGYGWLRDNPSGEAVLGSQAKVEGSHQVWRIDTTTGAALAIDTGGSKPVDIAIDANYEYMYVTLQGDDKVIQIQVSQGTAATRTGVEQVVGKGPGRLMYVGDMLGDMKHFFVLNTDPKDTNIPDSLIVLDGPPSSINNDFYNHHMIPLGNTPWNMVIKHMEHDHGSGEHGMRLYITQADQGDIAVVDISLSSSAAWKMVGTIPIAASMTDNYHGGLDGRFGLGEAVGGDASSQYSENAEHAGHQEHVHGGYGSSDGSMRKYTPHGIADSADAHHLYVTDYENGHLVIMDIMGHAPYNATTGTRMGAGGTSNETDTVHAHSTEEDMFSIQAGGHTGHDENVSTPGFDGPIPQEQQTTKYVRYRIPVGDAPEDIKIINGKLFVSLEGSHQIAVIDEADILAEIEADHVYYATWNANEPMRTLPTWNVRYIDVGARPTFMEYHANTGALYVTVNGQNQVVKIDVATETVSSRFNTGPNPKGLVVSPDGAHLYVVNHGGSGNLSFVYPQGAYIGDAFLGLEGGVEYQGAEHWVPNRSSWVYDPDTLGRVQSAAAIEFHVNEPFLNQGGFTKLSAYGIDPQWATIEQDVFNVVNYSNGNNVAFATAEQLKQDASLLRFWPKNEWLKEDGVTNIILYAKHDEFLTRDAVDSRIFYPSKTWIDNPERPVILMGLSGSYTEVSESEYVITYGESPKITFDTAVPGDHDVYSSSYYYSEVADPTQYTVYYDGEVETSASGTSYIDSHITFLAGYLPLGVIIHADYTFKHNRWFKNHNGSVMIATENSSSENFYVQFEVDEFVPKYITVDNQLTGPFQYWPIEVPKLTNANYTGVQYSAVTNQAIGATVLASAIPTVGTLDMITDNMEPATSEDEHTGMTMGGNAVELPAGLQHVVVDLEQTFMINKLHVMHAFKKNRIYHGTKTEVSQDGINWTTVYDSAVQGEYAENTYHLAHGHTHYGKPILFDALPVRYIRDWTNGYTEYATTSTDISTWDQLTVASTGTTNHWTEIYAYGDWEFEKEFSLNYTRDLLDPDITKAKPSFIKGGVTATGGTLATNIGSDNEQDVVRIVDTDLLPRRYFTVGNGTATVTVDLGAIEKVDTVRIFRYFVDGRSHTGVKTEISADGTTWTTVYDSAVNGTYEEIAGGKVLPLGGVQDVRYIRDTASGWTATLKSGTVLTGDEIRWIGIHAYLDYNPSYTYVYPQGAELEGQNLATNNQGVVTTSVSGAYAAVDIPIDFTSWWYMTYIVGPEFGQMDVEMPTVMGGSHSLFQDGPYLNKVAHRHIMSWPNSANVKEDTTQDIKMGMHRAIVRQKSGKVSFDRFRFEDYQYYYMNSIEISKGSATNFKREKIEPQVAKWYIGRGNQSTEGAYDDKRINLDTGKPDGSAAIKYRFRVKVRLNPSGVREERGVAYATSAIFETGRLSSHWRMSQAQDSFPGNRIQSWDPNQPHKTGIQHHHIANGSVRGSKLMPYAVMDHHISPYARIEESKLNLRYATHRHGHTMTMADGSTMWMDNKSVIDSIHGWGDSGTQNKMARADHTHDATYLKLTGGSITGNLAISGTVDGVDVSVLKTDFDTHTASADIHFSATERTKLTGITEGANKVAASTTNGNILVDGAQTVVYAHPTTAGNKHIPTGGAAGNFLKYSASGTAAWVNVSWSDIASKPSTFTPPIATASVLGGILVGTGLAVSAGGTLSWAHPTGDGQSHVPATGTTNSTKVLKAGAVANSAAWGQVQFSELGGSISAMQHGQLDGGSAHAVATATTAGFQSAADKAKLDGIEAGAINQTSGDARYLQLTGGTVGGDVTVNGLLTVGNSTASTTTVSFEGTTSAALKLQNANGYITLTPHNTGWAHIYTDRARFIFNQPVSTISNIFSSYNNDLILQRASSTVVTIGTTVATFATSVKATTFTNTNGTEVSYAGHRHDNATATADGFMSMADFTKLSGVEANANNYVHPTTHSLDMITETTTKKIMTDTERTKLAGVEANANNYVHPATHSLDVITETTDKKILTGAERTKLAGVEANAINQTTADGRYLQVGTGGSVNGNLSITSTGDAVLNVNADTDNDAGEIGEPKISLTQDGGIIGVDIKLAQSGAGSNTLVFAPFADYDTVTPVKNYNVFVHDKKVWHEGNLLKSEFATAGHVHANATISAHGFMSSNDKTKLDGVAANANNYVHPSTHSLDIITETTTKKIMTDAERTKLAGVATNANLYVHPDTHSITMITETLDYKVMTAAERTKLAGVEAGANNYTHPTTHSLDMITETLDKVVMTKAERDKLTGVAANANNYVHPASHALDMITETTTLKIMTADERTKLAGIATNANNYVHPSTHSLDMITETTTKKVMTDAERTKLSGIETGANLYVHPDTHPASMIVEAVDKRFFLDAERTKLSGIAANANNYSHPTTHPASMIVEAVDKRFMLDAERTKLGAIEAEANKYIHPATHSVDILTETAGLKVMTAAERTKLAGVADNANNYSHPATHPASIIVEAVDKRFMLDAERTKLSGIAANANNYAHPTGDGNLHVPATGTTNNTKVLKAGATAGSMAWGAVAYTELTGVPSTFTPSSHTHSTGEITGLDNALNARATLAGNNAFSGNNTFTNAGLSVKIQPSSAVAANTVLLQVNNSLGGSLVTMGASGAGESVARVVINGDLEVTGTTVQKSTQDIQGDMNVTGNLNVTGDAVLGDGLADQTRVNGDLLTMGNTTLGAVDKSVTAKGDLRVEGNFIPAGKYLEVGRFPIYGIAGDPQFQSDVVGTFEEIVDHIATFNTAGGSCLAPPATGATRFYKLMLSYSSTGLDDSVVRIVQGDGVTEVFSAALPAVNGTVLNRARTWMSAPFSTLHGGDTIFQAKKNIGGALAIRYVEVIALDYFN